MNQPSADMADALTEAELAEQFAEQLAMRIAQHLAAAAGGFPSAEDIARIRDHISPNGVAYQNGRRTALREVRAAINMGGAFGVLDLLTKEQV